MDATASTQWLFSSLLPDNKPFDVFLQTQAEERIQISGVRASDSVLTVKQKYHQLTGVRPEFVRFCYSGRELELGRPLSDYNIRSGAVIALQLKYVDV